MPDYNFKNNLKSTLQSKLWNDATTISCNHVVESGDAYTRRNAWPAFPFTLTLVNTVNDNIEVIKCTGLASNYSNLIAFTCARAQESTTAQTFETATTSVEHRLTAGALNAITGSLDEITSNVSDYMAGLAGKANADLSNVVLQPSMTGSATLNGTTGNTVQLTDIVITLGLEVGDVIRIQYSGYDKLHSVESITNNNSIIVNYEHAGNRGNGSLKLADQTTTVTITRIAKWYNAPLGLGQAWVIVKSRRTNNTVYSGLVNRAMVVSVTALSYPVMQISSDNITWLYLSNGSAGYSNNVAPIIPAGWYYKSSNWDFAAGEGLELR